MKKFIALALISAMLLSGCKSEQPLLENNGQIVEIQSADNVNRQEAVKNVISEYIKRVYTIDYSNYNPEYVDEATSAEEMISLVKELKMNCQVKEVIFAEQKYPNPNEAEAVVLITADYSSTVAPEGEYYMPMSIVCKLVEDEWKVSSSEIMGIASTETHNVIKNAVSGLYEFVPKNTTSEGG